MTLTCEPGFIMAVCINHGRPKHTRISKTFEPIAFDTAISPKPSLITAIELRASGTDTPAATNVNPITVSGMANVEPITVIIQTIKYE